MALWTEWLNLLDGQKKIARLQPELRHLKEQFGNQPRLYAEQLAALYRKNGMSVTDGRAILTALAQLPIFRTATNCYSAVQTAVLHRIVARRIRSGAVKI